MSNWCGVCGRELGHSHVCPKATLKGIEAANKQALDADDPENERCIGDDKPTIGERLHVGFVAMNETDEEV